MTNGMDRPDSDMMETDATAAAPPQPEEQNNVARDLIALARQLINEGKPSQALQAVVMAMRTKGGEEAVIQSLHRARELYINRLQQSTAVDQLASIFAECAIAEVQVQPLNDQPQQPQPLQCNASTITPLDGSSILSETGRSQIVLDAFSDGSSFICLKCGGLVSNLRKDEHYAYWCQVHNE